MATCRSSGSRRSSIRCSRADRQRKPDKTNQLPMTAGAVPGSRRPLSFRVRQTEPADPGICARTSQRPESSNIFEAFQDLARLSCRHRPVRCRLHWDKHASGLPNARPRFIVPPLWSKKRGARCKCSSARAKRFAHGTGRGIAEYEAFAVAAGRIQDVR